MKNKITFNRSLSAMILGVAVLSQYRQNRYGQDLDATTIQLAHVVFD
ncbi:MAG: hypothetical protein IIC60_10055 [Proteobacteria bacterium]|nr:hypothetical protein [Pseudomonadota bacterium]